MQSMSVGVDLAKRVLHAVALDGRSNVLWRRRLKRAEVLEFFAQQERCVVGIEACAAMHYWGRALAQLGHDVRAVHARFVKPYLKTNKNDFNDAEAIAEAVRRGNMRFVPIKSAEQQAILHVHRSRELLIRQRNALMNHVRALLAEYGVVMPVGAPLFTRRGEAAIEQLSREGSTFVCTMLRRLLSQIRALHEEEALLEREIRQWHAHSEASQRLAEIPGVGPITATAILGTIGDARRFKNGREMAAYLGLVPRQHSTGGKATLLGISKRGDRYVRTLLITGAQAAVWAFERRQRAGRASRNAWLAGLIARRPRNVAVVAQAHKNARTAWALLARSCHYEAAQADDRVKLTRAAA
jgi:transposase